MEQILSTVQDAYTWGVAVAISVTAGFLAVSLISWLIHRS